PAIANALRPGDVLFPLSQVTFSAARQSQLPMTPVPFWEALRGLDLEVAQRAANDALAKAVKDGSSCADLYRPRIWHNAREAAYVRLAAEKAIKLFRPSSLLAIAGVSESQGVLEAVRTTG